MPDQTQEQNSSQPTSQIMSEPTRAADDTEAALRQLGDTTVDTIKKPTTLAAIAGAAVVASAVTFGVLETAVGGAASYFAYRLLRRRRAESTAH